MVTEIHLAASLSGSRYMIVTVTQLTGEYNLKLISSACAFPAMTKCLQSNRLQLKSHNRLNKTNRGLKGLPVKRTQVEPAHTVLRRDLVR